MRVAIAGAGNVGRAIAKELIFNGHQVILLDRDPKAIKFESVPEAQWLLADACEISALDQAQLDTCQVMIAATGDDKVNLVTSFLAKSEYAVPRVVARVNHPKNEWMFDENWGVDVSVSTPRIIAALVEEAVSVGDVVQLFSIRRGSANIVEVTLSDTALACGKTVEELVLPDNCTLVAIIRDQQVISPEKHYVFCSGDELVFVAHPDFQEKLKSALI